MPQGCHVRGPPGRSPGPAYAGEVGIRKQAEEPDVVRITSAPANVADDVAQRQKRYLISMTIRTLCFVGAVLAFRIPWLCGVLIAASFVLPFVAVVVAMCAASALAAAAALGRAESTR